MRITAQIAVEDSELRLEFVRSSGPGGQNVNKVATAVQLRFDAFGSPSLPPEVRRRLARIAGKRMTADGILILRADRFRTQGQNRKDALRRLAELIRRAAVKPRRRRSTRPTKASVERKLTAKRHRSRIKRLRRRVRSDEA